MFPTAKSMDNDNAIQTKNWNSVQFVGAKFACISMWIENDIIKRDLDNSKCDNSSNQIVDTQLLESHSPNQNALPTFWLDECYAGRYFIAIWLDESSQISPFCLEMRNYTSLQTNMFHGVKRFRDCRNKTKLLTP